LMPVHSSYNQLQVLFSIFENSSFIGLQADFSTSHLHVHTSFIGIKTAFFNLICMFIFQSFNLKFIFSFIQRWGSSFIHWTWSHTFFIHSTLKFIPHPFSLEVHSSFIQLKVYFHFLKFRFILANTVRYWKRSAVLLARIA
jgi:hypothetical protein